MKPKYRIVRTKHFVTLFNVEKRVLWFWKLVHKEQGLDYCIQYCENAMSPIVKEY